MPRSWGGHCWAPAGQGGHLLSLSLDKVKGKCSKCIPCASPPDLLGGRAAFEGGGAATRGPQGRRGPPALSKHPWVSGSPEAVVPCMCSQSAFNLKVIITLNPLIPPKGKHLSLG